jgi:flagellar hook assembly protein FlgD
MQRGGVQILKNVINPDKGEVTTLQFTQAKAGSVTVTVFDLSGSIIRVLARGNRSAGDYGITWDGTNRSGAKVTRGLYFIKVIGPGIDEIRKVLVVR